MTSLRMKQISLRTSKQRKSRISSLWFTSIQYHPDNCGVPNNVMISSILYLAAFWGLLHILQWLYETRRPTRSRSTFDDHGATGETKTVFELSWFSLNVSTTFFNSIPKRILAVFSFLPFGVDQRRLGAADSHVSVGELSNTRRNSKDPSSKANNVSSRPRKWSLHWDLGVIIVLLGVLFAQIILHWALLRATGSLFTLIFSSKPDVRRSANYTLTSANVKRGQETRYTKAFTRVLAKGRRLFKKAVIPITKNPKANVGTTAEGNGSRAIRDPASNLALRLVIPGVTMPFAELPLLLVSLFVSQIFHELGHALAAASEFIPLLSTGIRLYLCIPTFYVHLPSLATAATAYSRSTLPSLQQAVSSTHLRPMLSNSLTDLRISSGGVYHNICLCAFMVLLSSSPSTSGSVTRRQIQADSHGPILFRGVGMGRWIATGLGIGRLSMWETVDDGVLVVDVTHDSPLSQLLPPGTVITHLNDLELDASSDPSSMWTSFLTMEQVSKNTHSIQSAAPNSYDNLGWCLPLNEFSPSPIRCCLSHGEDKNKVITTLGNDSKEGIANVADALDSRVSEPDRAGLEGVLVDTGNSWNEEGGVFKRRSAHYLMPRAVDSTSSTTKSQLLNDHELCFLIPTITPSRHREAYLYQCLDPAGLFLQSNSPTFASTFAEKSRNGRPLSALSAATGHGDETNTGEITKVTRCLSNENCKESLGCARIREDEDIVRIGIKTPFDDRIGRGASKGTGGHTEAIMSRVRNSYQKVKQGGMSNQNKTTDRSSTAEAEKDDHREKWKSEVIIYQGPKIGIFEHVRIESLKPKYWWIGVRWLHVMEAFYSNIFSLSLALAFFNLLPLPHLDGSYILSSFLIALLTASSFNTIYSTASDVEEGLLPRGLLTGSIPQRRSAAEHKSGGWGNSGLLEMVISHIAKTVLPNKAISGSPGSSDMSREDAVSRRYQKWITRIEKWTTGVALALLGISILVEIMASKERAM